MSENGKVTIKPLQGLDINLLKAPEQVIIKVETEYGRRFEFPFTPLTHHRFMEIEGMIQDPPVPRTGLDPTNGKPILNPNDPEYLLARADAANMRDFLRIAEGMTNAGNELPGDDLMAKAEWLRDNLDSAMANILVNALWKVSRKGATLIEDRAASFHAVSAGGTADVQEAGQDA